MSDAAHRAEVRDLRTSLAAVLVPTGALAALGFAATPTDGAMWSDRARPRPPDRGLLALGVAAAVSAARDPGRLRPVLALSVLGFSLAAVYAVIGAPDVALVAVLVETVVTLVFVAVFSRLPGATVGRPTRAAPAPRRRNGPPASSPALALSRSSGPPFAPAARHQ